MTRLVYTNTIGILSGAIVARLNGLPHIWHIHEIITSPKIVSRFLSWFVPKFSTLVLCNSIATQNHLLSRKSPEKAKCSVIHNGIDVKRFANNNSRQKTRSNFKLGDDEIFVGVIGRIHFWKGQDYFLEAAHLLLRDHTRNVFFGIIGSVYDPGDDNQLEKLKTQAKKLGIEDRVILIDFEEKIEDVYAALDIVVVPSRLPEPFGLVTIEAMASKKPVIATSHGGSLEIVEDGISGFLVPTDNPEALAEKIMVLVENPTMRKNMGLSGHRIVQEKFSEEHFNAEMRNLLMDIFVGTRANKVKI